MIPRHCSWTSQGCSKSDAPDCFTINFFANFWSWYNVWLTFNATIFRCVFDVAFCAHALEAALLSSTRGELHGALLLNRAALVQNSYLFFVDENSLFCNLCDVRRVTVTFEAFVIFIWILHISCFATAFVIDVAFRF